MGPSKTYPTNTTRRRRRRSMEEAKDETRLEGAFVSRD